MSKTGTLKISRLHKFVVYQQQGVVLRKFRVIEAKTDGSIRSTEQLLSELRRGVRQWVQNTEDGKNRLAYAGEDMSIGDIIEYLDGILKFCPMIDELDVKSIEIADDWVYDTPVI